MKVAVPTASLIGWKVLEQMEMPETSYSRYGAAQLSLGSQIAFIEKEKNPKRGSSGRDHPTNPHVQVRPPLTLIPLRIVANKGAPETRNWSLKKYPSKNKTNKNKNNTKKTRAVLEGPGAEPLLPVLESKTTSADTQECGGHEGQGKALQPSPDDHTVL